MYKKIGFTLIEMLIVIAIIAILTAIALPSYQAQVRKSRRAEALRVIQEIRMAQERWRADRPTYGTLADMAAVGGPNTGGNPNFVYTVTLPAGALTYTITATAQLTQVNDRQGAVICTPLTITNAGVQTPAACWQK